MNEIKIRKWHTFVLLLKRDGWERAKYICRHNLFHSMGIKCYYHPYKLPAEPHLISMGDNVFIGTNVHLLTHNMANVVFNNMKSNINECNRLIPIAGSIIIGSNVFIGANATILYNVSIGNNCIIAANAVVTHDVPSGSVVAGVPAKIIDSFDNQKSKCAEFTQEFNKMTGHLDMSFIEKQRAFFMLKEGSAIGKKQKDGE